MLLVKDAVFVEFNFLGELFNCGSDYIHVSRVQTPKPCHKINQFLKSSKDAKDKAFRTHHRFQNIAKVADAVYNKSRKAAQAREVTLHDTSN